MEWILLLATLAGQMSEEPKTIAYQKSPSHFLIVAKIEFFGDFSLPLFFEKLLLSWIVKKAEQKWNQNSKFFDPKKKQWIHLEFRIRWKIRSHTDPTTPGYHQILLVPIWKDWLRYKLTGKSKLLQGHRSWMYIGGRKKGISGAFGVPITPTIMAHEFGHLFGLKDEYKANEPLWKRHFLNLLQRSYPPSIMEFSSCPWAVPKEKHYQRIYQNLYRYGWLSQRKTR